MPRRTACLLAIALILTTGDTIVRTAAPAPAATKPVSTADPWPRSPRNANYTIDARLDPAQRSIKGTEVIFWRNMTATATSELQFHLYWNAWRNTRSTFMRETALTGNREPGDRPADDFSRIDVTAVRVVTGTGRADLTSQQRFLAPDDGNADDRTVMAVPLPAPVAAGQTIEIEVEWTAKVPRAFARTGAIDNYFFIAQWFPKLGVLQDSGWNTHQFHRATEFFSDYGVYDVRMTVPRGWTVGATGTEVGRRDEANGTTTHQYHEADVHDFAWTTSPDYEVFTRRFEDAGLPPVTMRLLQLPEHRGQQWRHFAATEAALRHYGTWFGAYPYGHVTIVDPAFESGADGMEYPTLFTAGSHWLAPRGVTTPESVTVHEAGHQFWYGIVGNNEFEHAWLDEGLNTFSTARTIEQAFTPNFLAIRYFGGFVPWVFRDIPLSREISGNRLAGYRDAAKMDIQSTPTFRYWPRSASAITYNKTALWLHTLERHLGWPTLQRILSTFFERWKFRHPAPNDFFAVANEVGGQDLTWFFDQVHRSSNVFDYGVQELRSERIATRGFGDGPRAAFATSDVDAHRTIVVVRRYGEAVFPVDVLVTFRGGQQVRERWDGIDRWKLYQYDRKEQALSVQVDPDRVLLLDVNYTNNSRTLEPQGGRAATKWSLKWMVWLQDLMLTYGFFV